MADEIFKQFNKKDFKILDFCYIIYKTYEFKGVNKMQTRTKRFTIIAITFILSLVLIACGGSSTTDSLTTKDTPEPNITGLNAVFYSTDDFDVTYRDLYNSVKVNDGIHQLLALVDIDLLSDYLESITQEQIDKKITKLTYGTTDPEEIAELTLEEVEEAELTFVENMYLRGYTEANYEDYVKIVLARELYATELMLSDDSLEETWHVGPKEIASYYENKYNKETRTLKIKFASELDAITVLKSYNLVSKDNKIMLYTGTTPIEEVPSFALNETNTRDLTEEELFSYFLNMYNDVYGGYKDEIAPETTFVQLTEMDDLILNYNDVSVYNANLAKYIFTSLNTYEEFSAGEDLSSYYTYKPEKFYSGQDTAYYLIMNLAKVNDEEVVDFTGTKQELVTIIGEDIYNEIETTIIDANIELQNFVNKRVAEYRSEFNFTIHDKYIAMDYKVIHTDYEDVSLGSTTLIASYNGIDVSADELLTYALNNNAPMYLISAAQTKALINAHFEDVYCLDTSVCEYDYLENESAKMLEHINAFNDMQTQFEASMYAQYYTFEEYLYLAYGVKDIEGMLNDYYIKQSLQPLYIFDQIQENNYEVLNDLLDLMAPYYENYFSLNATHLLIYVDRDEDGSPDDYDEFYADLADTTEFDAKLAALEVKVREYLEVEENSFTTLTEAYRQASRSDETWGEFKSYGFYFYTENLSSQGSLTYSSTINKYEQDFVDRLVELYQEYNLEENLDKDSILDSAFLETSFGLHLIKVVKGSAFEMPSAEFTMTYNSSNEAEFTVGIENESEFISFEQLKLYAMYRFSVITFGSIDLSDSYGFTRPNIPTSVSAALTEFASKLHDALYVVGYMNVAVIDELNNGEFVNEDSRYFDGNATDFLNTLNQISEIYYRQIFLELDLR